MTACAFRLCTTNVIMVVEQATPGDDETTLQRYPIHDIGGLESYGRCPASLLAVPLDDYLLAMLDEAAKTIEQAIAIAEAAHQETKPATGSNGSKPKPTPDPRWFRGSPGGNPTAGRANREPGISGYPTMKFEPTPPKPSPAPTTGAPNVSDSMRGQLRALTILATEALGQAQEKCAIITHLAEQIDAVMQDLQAKQAAAYQLAVGAVGGSGSAPEAATNMVAGARTAMSTTDDAQAALQLLLVRVAVVAGTDAAAATNGVRYLGVL